MFPTMIQKDNKKRKKIDTKDQVLLLSFISSDNNFYK